MTPQQRSGLRRLVRSMYDFQRLRIQAQGRGTKQAAHSEVVLDADDVAVLDKLGVGLTALEAQTLAEIEQRVREDEVGLWLLAQRGIGPTLAGAILSEIDFAATRPGGGDLTVSSLWKFAGLAPVAGRAEHATKGQKRHYNAWLKTKLVGVLGDCVLKACVRTMRPAKGGKDWIEAAWEKANREESTDNRERAVVDETPDTAERADDSKTTDGGERAKMEETPTRLERAIHAETSETRERADVHERSVSAERAVRDETSTTRERASVQEIPVADERAIHHETSEDAERAAAFETPVPAERLVRRWVTGYAVTYAEYRWRLLHRIVPCMACANRSETTDLEERAIGAESPEGNERAVIDETSRKAERAVNEEQPVRAERCRNCNGTGRGPWGRSSAHRHRAAIRYMVKMFLRDLYVVGRTAYGLPVRPPYADEKLRSA